MIEDNEVKVVSGKRIAVIAIHGVGEHEAGETAKALTKQLLSVCTDRYRAEQTSELYLVVDTTHLFPPGSPDQENEPMPRSFARFKRGLGSAYSGREKPANLPFDQRFTTALLDGGKKTPQTHYLTSRHRLLRQQDAQLAQVDIHEMHWSDLSHGGISGSWKIFEQFSQLLLHIAGLGRTTLAMVAEQRKNLGKPSSAWQRQYHLSAASYWLLTLPILQGNLLFFLLASLMLPALIHCHVLGAACAVVIGAVVAGLIGGYFFSKLEQARPAQKHWRQAPPLSLLFGAAAGGSTLYFPHGVQFGLLVLVATVLLLVLGDYCMRSYDRSRPGSLIFWRLLACLTLIWGCIVALAVSDESVIAGDRYWLWLAHTAEGIFVVLVGIWIALFGVNLLQVIGALRLRFSRDSNDKQIHSLQTSLIAAALPPPLLLSVILLLWTMGYYAFAPSIPSMNFEPWITHLFPGEYTAKSFLWAMIAKSATDAFIPYLGVIALATLLVTWGILPSVKAELSRPPFAFVPNQTKRLGNWLDGGFTAMAWAAAFACIGFFVLMPSGVVTQTLGYGTGQGEWMVWVAPMIGAGSATFLSASKLFYKNFSSFFARLRVAVDAALDVDNWLRERPRGATPRLHIFARYNALFRHLQQENYDKIVIVAHSQGTVVTTDFFRYLKYQLPEQLGAIPIELFSMGCPLRQLYALRFPLLYGWVHQAEQPENPAPNPAECGFSYWVNAYGSGDYVGRHLWANDDSAQRWDDTPQHIGNNAEEFCLGAQAHTHYFDADNRLVGERLNKLIGR